MHEIISIQEYTYELPQDRIALQPLLNRDDAKLLVYRNGDLEHSTFKQLANFLPPNAFLFFNDTKVIPARIYFQKDSGAEIEIFLLNPLEPSTLLADAMTSQKHCTWHCTIGNLKRWKDGQVLQKQSNEISVTASLLNRAEGIVKFSWATPQSFAEVLSVVGITPLPPYIKREASKEDSTRYQTIYSNYEGAVAAPTAGLHFTAFVFESLAKKNIEKDFLTLHVSAGTFQPVKTENALDHTMHQEQLVVSRQSIENLLRPDKFIVAVGTTSARTLESLYWFGVKLLENPKAEFNITQQDAYGRNNLPTVHEAIQQIAHYMDTLKLNVLTGNTAIFIYPGYEFKVCRGLITNFHLPASTLMLLIAAFIGHDWKTVYEQALNQNYRFLSYGDSSLLIP